MYPAYSAAARTQRKFPNAAFGFETPPDSITTSSPSPAGTTAASSDGASRGTSVEPPDADPESARVTSTLPSTYARIARTRSLLYRSFTNHTLSPNVNIALEVLSIEFEVTDVYSSE